MKKKAPFLIAVGILLIAIVVVVVVYQGTRSGSAAYEEVLITYLEAMKEGPEQAIEYTAFPNETIEYDYLHSLVHIVDYEVVSSTEVNENLYAFTLNIAGSDQPEVYTPVYYFVGQQDGEYTVYINVSYVPESLRENLSVDDYSYSNPDYLDSIPEIEN